jgi:thiol-disulfide isomerase/thioredoxin
MVDRRALMFLLACLGVCLPPVGAGELLPYRGPDPVELSLPDEQGHRQDIDGLRGQVVLVNFWATWCGPCIIEIPSLRELYGRMSGRPFEILAVNVEEGEFRVHKFTRQVEMPFPILFDRDGAVFERWQAGVLPTSYLLDPEGRVRYRVQGSVDWMSPAALEIVEGLLPVGAVE